MEWVEIRSQKKAIFLFTVLILINLSLLSLPAAANGEAKPTVVCTNTILSSFAKQVGGDEVSVISIMPPGICPAHYDITPADIYAVSNASLVLSSGIEPWLASLVNASGNQDVTLTTISGSWHPYTNGMIYLNAVKSAMIGVFPEHSSEFEAKYQLAKDAINSTAQSIKAEADALNVSQINVVCMSWQSEFISWLGFNITATYGPPEALSTADILELTSTAEETSVAIVIDNLPSGTAFGAKLASDVGAEHVILSNFPWAVPNTENYTRMIQYNAEQLFDAVERYRLIQGEISELTKVLANVDLLAKVFMSTTLVFLTVAVVEAAIIIRKPKM